VDCAVLGGLGGICLAMRPKDLQGVNKMENNEFKGKTSV
jgi:hypothetical protein